MITVRLKGGMGNQMFQYAFAKRIAHFHNTQFKLDLSTLLDRNKGDFVYRDYDLDIFNLEPEFVMNPSLLRLMYKVKSGRITKFIRKLSYGNLNYLKEKHFHVVEDLLNNPPDHTVYEGWWQSEQYFAEVADEIRADFTFKEGILPSSAEVHQKIQTTNSVCLNVRRTDFLKVPWLNSTDMDYFLRAVKYMAEHVADPSFFVFSDDIEWCRENIRLDYPVTIVGHEHKGRKFGNYQQLMKACKHFIIPNSSYAWWAVWLNENPSKVVVAPKIWFADAEINTGDVIPESWVRL